MKPPSRQRTQPQRYLHQKPEPETKTTKVCKGWSQTEKRTLIQILNKQSKMDVGCNGEIRLAELREKLPKRFTREIETLLAAMKTNVVRVVRHQLAQQRRKQKKARVPIELWAEMAAEMAGSLEEPITAAFSQMLVTSSTEPCSLKNSDPPRVAQMPLPANTRTIPFRPMPVPMARPLFKPTQIVIAAKPPYISPGRATLSPAPPGACSSPRVVYIARPQSPLLTPGRIGAAQPASAASGLTSRGAGTIASLPARVSRRPVQPAGGASTTAFVTAPLLLTPASAIVTSLPSPSPIVTSSQRLSATVTTSPQPPSAIVTSSQPPSAFPSGTGSIAMVTGSSMATVTSLQPTSAIVTSLPSPSPIVTSLPSPSAIVTSLPSPSAIVTSLRLPSPFVTSSQPSSASSSVPSAPQLQLKPQAQIFMSSGPAQPCVPAVFQPTVTTARAVTSVSNQQPSSHAPSASTTTPHTKFGRASKFDQEDQPRGNLGLRCAVDFEKVYRYLSNVHKPNEEYNLTPMESAVVLDLLMSLPEELPLLDCARLQKHMTQVHERLSSPLVSIGSRRREGQQAVTNAATSTQAGRQALDQSAAANKTSSQSENPAKVTADWEKAGVCPLNPFMVPLKLLARR